MLQRAIKLVDRAYNYATRKRIEVDPFVSWLNIANAGMLHPGNLYCLDHAIRNMPDNCSMVEIGTFCGLSANVITRMKQRHNRHNVLFTCDKWDFEGATEGPIAEGTDITHAVLKQHVKDSFVRNVRLFSAGDLPFTIECYSDEFFHRWRGNNSETDVHGRPVQLGGPIGFCYIDGDHSYEQVKKDFANVDEFLAPGGYILFDDSASFDGVNRAVQEILRQGRYELVIRNPNHLLRKPPA